MSRKVTNTDIRVNSSHHDINITDGTTYQPIDKETLLTHLRKEMGEQDYIKMLKEEMQRYKIETSPLYKVLNDGK